MAHNFRYVVPAGTTAYYVSQGGDDSKSGLTPDDAKKTIAAARAAIAALPAGSYVVAIVIGSGTYEESFVGTSRIANGSRIVADGNVILRGNGSNSISMGSSGSTALEGLIIENYASIGLNSNLTNCLFKNIASISGANSVGVGLNCIWINSTFPQPVIMQHNYSIFIDCSLLAAHVNIVNCYFNGNSYITMANLDSTIQQFNYNNIMGMIRSGTSGTYKNLADWKTERPAWNQNSINAAPMFNSVSRLDFSLQINSPHIGAASDNTKNIGGTIFGVASVAQTAAEWQVANGAVVSQSNGTPDLIIVGTDWQINTAQGKTKGTIISAPIAISANPVQLQKIQYNGLFLFNKLQAGGSGTNNNVPDANVQKLADAPAGANPDRLTYEMRWTDNDTKPGSGNVDWINSGITNPGEFLLFEWNTQPLFDNTGLGNGHPSFNQNGIVSPVSAVWIQLRVTLTNEYTN